MNKKGAEPFSQTSAEEPLFSRKDTFSDALGATASHLFDPTQFDEEPQQMQELRDIAQELLDCDKATDSYFDIHLKKIKTDELEQYMTDMDAIVAAIPEESAGKRASLATRLMALTELEPRLLDKIESIDLRSTDTIENFGQESDELLHETHTIDAFAIEFCEDAEIHSKRTVENESRVTQIGPEWSKTAAHRATRERKINDFVMVMADGRRKRISIRKRTVFAVTNDFLQANRIKVSGSGTTLDDEAADKIDAILMYTNVDPTSGIMPAREITFAVLSDVEDDYVAPKGEGPRRVAAMSDVLIPAHESDQESPAESE